MARKPAAAAAAPKPALELTVSREEAKQRLLERMERGRELRHRQVDSRETYAALERDYGKWNDFNVELLKRVFTTDELANEYSFWSGGVISMSPFGGGPSLGQEIADQFKEIDEKIHRLDSIVERLELIPIQAAAGLAAAPSGPAPVAAPERTNKVFVVHGHDEAAKTSLEVFLREIGLDPIVLHRQADQGLTVIEKFEKHSDVGYAFVLLTPDEVAYVAAEAAKPDDQRKKEFRARPNVIFEFGYFVGKLGRGRVCCLYTGNVSLPSDLGGLIYKQYAKSVEEVAYPIIKDLKAAGYTTK